MLRIGLKYTVLHADSENTVENLFKACFRIVFQDFRLFRVSSCLILTFYRTTRMCAWQTLRAERIGETSRDVSWRGLGTLRTEKSGPVRFLYIPGLDLNWFNPV